MVHKSKAESWCLIGRRVGETGTTITWMLVTSSFLNPFRISFSPSSKRSLHTTTHLNSPLCQLRLQLTFHLSFYTQIVVTMFRNALRQSSRTVGAIGATRVAAVRSQQQSPNPLNKAAINLDGLLCLVEAQLILIERWKSMVESCFGASI